MSYSAEQEPPSRGLGLRQGVAGTEQAAGGLGAGVRQVSEREVRALAVLACEWNRGVGTD